MFGDLFDSKYFSRVTFWTTGMGGCKGVIARILLLLFITGAAPILGAILIGVVWLYWKQLLVLLLV
jgi:hypothetical protein